MGNQYKQKIKKSKNLMNVIKKATILLNATGEILHTEWEKLFNKNWIDQCTVNQPTPMADFDAEKYFGFWYEQNHVTEFEVFQPVNAQCITAEYIKNDDGTSVVKNFYQTGEPTAAEKYFTDALNSVKNQLPKSFTEKLEKYQYEEIQHEETVDLKGFSRRTGITGKAKCEDGVGSCTVAFFGQNFDSVPNYTVLDTDYENYSIVYNCEPLTQYKIVWILSRTPNLDEATYAKVRESLKEKVPTFDASHFDGRTYQGEQ